jgi:RND family efflux transporter MFP subunit
MTENNPRIREEGVSRDHRPEKYRRAFLLTFVAFVVVAGAAVWLWWRSPFNPMTRSQQPSVTASAASETSQATKEPAASAETGAPSQADTVLAPIQLSPQRMQSIGVKVGTVDSKVVSDEIRSSGNVQANERRFAYVQTRFAGWIRKVYVDATGDFVEKGQPLFTVYSPDVVASEREYLLAKKSATTLQQSAVSGVADGAASLIIASKSRLQQFDISANDIAKLDDTGEPITDLTVNSPVTGYVTEKNSPPNMYVQQDTKLYTIADLSEIWVFAQIFQNDAGKIRPGDSAEVTVDAYPGQTFKGKVDYLLPQLDMTTRTLPVRLVIPNPGLKLRPGMYVNVDLKLPLGQRLVVPDSAVFHSGTKNLIFTYAGEGNIEPREVELGPHVGDLFVISKGAKAGEQIVTSANFLIDSEAQLAAAAGAFMPPPPGGGQGTAMNVPAPAQANVELATVPSPPQKGVNTIRVMLTDQAGKPIGGAQVNVTFFMAAMPAMDMAAMTTVIQASDKGGGMYEGDGALRSGGIWQVTITAQQNGQTIANKHISLRATGGL